jgi:hypothetical protein
MVIPLTLEVLILREKKNKRKTMMNNITNTMCRLSDLTQEQIDRLVDVMPRGHFDFYKSEKGIGATSQGNWGTWDMLSSPSIVTYKYMMQLLGNNMNKQTAQEQMAVMQIEMDKLKAIINKPEAKTGRVLCMDDLKRATVYWTTSHAVFQHTSSCASSFDHQRVSAGTAFHDKETAERHLEYLKLEQELRRAQIADGEAIGYERYNVILNGKDGKLHTPKALVFHEKISFNTEFARDVFRNTHTDEQLTLLIRGV